MDRLYNVCWSLIGIASYHTMRRYDNYIFLYFMYFLSFTILVEMSRFEYEYIHSMVIIPIFILFDKANISLYTFNILINLFPSQVVLVFIKTMFLTFCAFLNYLKWGVMVLTGLFVLNEWMRSKQKLMEEYGSQILH